VRGAPGAGSSRAGRLRAGALLLSAALVACSEAPPRHVVVIVLDTLRPDRLSLHGHPAPTSPHLDALAQESRVFADAQSPSPWTAPSLLSLVTSLRPEAHGVYRFPNPGRMPDEIATLAETLRAAGFRTAAFTEGGYAKGEFGLDQGFDVFPANPGDAAGHASNLQHPSRLAGNVDRALAWLDERSDAPGFLLFHTYESHFPYRAPTEHIARFWPGYRPERERAALADLAGRWNAALPLSAADWDRLLIHHLHCQLRELPAVRDRSRLLGRVLGRIAAFEAGRLDLEPGTLERIGSLYDAEIHYLDTEIGRLLEGVASTIGESLLVVVSDHGEGLGQHRRIQHGTHLHDELTRVLLLLRAPGVEPGRVRTPVSTLDVVPTVLEQLGIEPVGLVLQGRSLLEPAEERAVSASARAVTGEELRWRSLRTRRFALLEDGRTGEAALYDRRTDPGEARNVAERHPDVVARLRDALRRVAEADAARGATARPTPLPARSEEELRALGYID